MPDWTQEKLAEIEAQIGRKIEPPDWACLDINESARTVTVARDPLLSEIRLQERTRTRGLDLPPNP